MKAAIYLRVSTKEKGQDIENQRPAILAALEANKWTLAAEYRDELTASGKVSRTGFDQLMKDAEKRRFGVVVVWSLDRFSREGVYETLTHIRRLDSWGVGFLSVQEQYVNTLGPFREAILALLAAIARIERERIAERTRAGLDKARAQGKRLGRPNIAVPDTLDNCIRAGLTTREIAKIYNVGKSTVHRWISSRRIAPSSLNY